MEKQKIKKESALKTLFDYAGSFRYLSILSWILSGISALIALAPFYFIWKIIKEVLRVAPEYGQAENLSTYGWEAVGFAFLDSFSII